MWFVLPEVPFMPTGAVFRNLFYVVWRHGELELALFTGERDSFYVFQANNDLALEGHFNTADDSMGAM